MSFPKREVAEVGACALGLLTIFLYFDLNLIGVVLTALFFLVITGVWQYVCQEDSFGFHLKELHSKSELPLLAWQIGVPAGLLLWNYVEILRYFSKPHPLSLLGGNSFPNMESSSFLLLVLVVHGGIWLALQGAQDSITIGRSGITPTRREIVLYFCLPLALAIIFASLILIIPSFLAL